MAQRIAVVLSQGQSQNPAKRDLEEDIVAALIMEPGIDVTVIPNLYDLTADSTGMLALQGIKGSFVLLSWLFPRAAHWILDRNGIRGQFGETLLVSDADDEEDEEANAEPDDKDRVIDSRSLPNRKIYSLDLRALSSPRPYIDEVKRIAKESQTKVVDLMNWIGGSPKPEQMTRFLQPTNTSGLGVQPVPAAPALVGVVPLATAENPNGNGHGMPAQVVRIADVGDRRWYPVIDYSRCTNCMECIDFCLFGVYGVDKVDTILVEQPDNCRKGCPACSRVCPENAIIFPQHKTPAIAGAPAEAGATLKIDLSQLFGAPEKKESAMEVAARERDEQLALAGRQTVGLSVGIPKRQAVKTNAPGDELDSLLDELDNANL